MRRPLAVILACLAALPAQADIIENEAMKVFEGRWVQSKDPAQNGALMYVTQARSEVGEYFSIRCEDGGPSVRIAFPRRISGKDIGVTIDGTEARVPAEFASKTKDPHFLKGNVFGYALNFGSDAEEQAFLASVAQGRMMTIEGQTHPIDLQGAGQAVVEQAGYCR